MSLADELAAFTVSVRARPNADLGELVEIVASLDHGNWEELDEDRDSGRYRWSCVLELRLTTGELRRGWREGTHDDSNLVDNAPYAAICVPARELPSPLRVRVRGELAFNAGPRIAWDHELDAGAGDVALALVLVDDAPTIESIAPRAVDATVAAIAIAPSDARTVACLPERGLVTFSRTAGYALHTPAGTRALPELAAILAALPGRETGQIEYRGGPRGRLAIEIQRNYHEHVVVVEIDERGVRRLHTGDGLSLTRGGFDATGAWLLVRTREHRRIDANHEGFDSWTQVLDCDAGRILDWRGASADLHGRWQLDRDVLAGTTGTIIHLVPRTGAPSSTRIPIEVGSHPTSAWHPAAGVAAWADRRGHALPQALHCYHPSWGVRMLALPAGAERLAVLRDGRIVVTGDRLLVVDAGRGEIADLGAIDDHLGDLLQIIETDDAAILWTLARARWRIELPRPVTSR